MKFATQNLALAHSYHCGHVEHCTEQINKANSFFKRIKLKSKWGIEPEKYKFLMKEYIKFYNKEEEFEQQVSNLDWEFLALMKKMKKNVPKAVKENIKKSNELRKERGKWANKRNLVEEELRKYKLCTSQII